MNALAVKVHKHTRSAMHTMILICIPYYDHPYISTIETTTARLDQVVVSSVRTTNYMCSLRLAPINSIM